MVSRLFLILFFCVLVGETWAKSKGTGVYISSERFPGVDSALVFMPESGAKNLPVIYLLNGYGAALRSFTKVADLDSLANAHRLILVCVDGGGDSWYINDPSDNKRRYEDYFFKDLLPQVEKWLGPKVDTLRRGLLGISMGGHGAIRYFALHNNRFAACGASSGVMDLSASKMRDQVLARMFGEYAANKTKFLQYSAVSQVKYIKGSRKPLKLDCGSEDYLLESNKVLVEECKRQQVQVEFSTSAGGHHISYWKKTIPEQITYLAKHLKQK
jgi:S-formylglutathione hydrolase FrmB